MSNSYKMHTQNHTILFRKAVTVFLCLLLISVNACSRKVTEQTNPQSLIKGFLSPPPSSKPGVYWYFMDGNMTKESMTADLESMKKVGIGSLVFL
jgi:hypothetical protein